MYAWSATRDTLYSHLFIGGELDVTETFNGKIRIETGYPYAGTVRYTFMPAGDTMPMTLALRVPAWSERTEIYLNGRLAELRAEQGYAYLTHAFAAADTVELRLDMNPRRVFTSTEVAANSGRVAFMAGPLVYCLEGADQEGDVLALRVGKEAKPRVLAFDAALLNGCAPMLVDGYRVEKTDALYTTARPKADACTLRLIPYYAWANRGLSQMRVWIPEMA